MRTSGWRRCSSPSHDELVERLAPAAGRAVARPRDGHRRDRDARGARGRGGHRDRQPGADAREGRATTPSRRASRSASTSAASSTCPTTTASSTCSPRASASSSRADHANVAGELARVARPGGRLGFTAWKPNPKLGELYRRFTEEPIEGREADRVGPRGPRRGHARRGLRARVRRRHALDRRRARARSSGSSSRRSAPPVMALAEPARRRARPRTSTAAFVELYEGYRDGDRIRAPRRYLLTLGTRR